MCYILCTFHFAQKGQLYCEKHYVHELTEFSEKTHLLCTNQQKSVKKALTVHEPT
jgi:hypothetical protein